MRSIHWRVHVFFEMTSTWRFFSSIDCYWRLLKEPKGRYSLAKNNSLPALIMLLQAANTGLENPEPLLFCYFCLVLREW